MQLSSMDIKTGSPVQQQDLNKILTLVPLLVADIPWQVEKQPGKKKRVVKPLGIGGKKKEKKH